MISSWGVSTFACVDLATVWSRTRRFHTFFFFFNFDTTGQILAGIYSLIRRIKTLFCKKLEAGNYQFSEIHFALLHQPGLASILRSHMVEKCCFTARLENLLRK